MPCIQPHPRQSVCNIHVTSAQSPLQCLPSNLSIAISSAILSNKPHIPSCTRETPTLHHHHHHLLQTRHLRRVTLPPFPRPHPHAPQVQSRRAEEMKGLPYPLPALPRSMLQQRPLTSFPAPFPLWLNTCYFASQSLLLAQFPNMSRMPYTSVFACRCC